MRFVICQKIRVAAIIALAIIAIVAVSVVVVRCVAIIFAVTISIYGCKRR